MINLEQLQQEMADAGLAIVLTQLGDSTVMAATPTSLEPLPPEAQAVLDRHVGRPKIKNTRPVDKLAAMKTPRVISGSRSTDLVAILAGVLQAAEEAGIIIDQTRP